MEIDLSRVESEPLSFAEELRLVADRLDASRVADEIHVHLEGSICRRQHGWLWATGEIRWSGRLLCVRCLEPVPWEAQEGFAFELRRREEMPGDDVELEDDDLEVVFLEGEKLDLADVAAEQILLALPMRVLCRDGCAGLCPRCGGNRNLEGGCGCEPEIDPRWQALKELSGREGAS